MTIAHLQSYVDELGPLEAQAQLDAAQVAVYPYLLRYARAAATDWWDRLYLLAVRTAKGAAEQAQQRVPLPFTFNGVAVSAAGLKSRIRGIAGMGITSSRKAG